MEYQAFGGNWGDKFLYADSVCVKHIGTGQIHLARLLEYWNGKRNLSRNTRTHRRGEWGLKFTVLVEQSSCLLKTLNTFLIALFTSLLQLFTFFERLLENSSLLQLVFPRD